jgi:uncharacterized protein (DUF1697 family)
MKKISRVFIGLVVAVVALARGGASTKPIPVEFWHTGDDGLSQKLAYQVERAFERSTDFTLRDERRPETLVVRIPTNVDWNKVGKRTQVLYTVEFSSADNQTIGVRKGSCWEDQLAKCTAQILRDAKIAAHKLH